MRLGQILQSVAVISTLPAAILPASVAEVAIGQMEWPPQSPADCITKPCLSGRASVAGKTITPTDNTPASAVDIAIVQTQMDQALAVAKITPPAKLYPVFKAARGT